MRKTIICFALLFPSLASAGLAYDYNFDGNANNAGTGSATWISAPTTFVAGPTGYGQAVQTDASDATTGPRTADTPTLGVNVDSFTFAVWMKVNGSAWNHYLSFGTDALSTLHLSTTDTNSGLISVYASSGALGDDTVLEYKDFGTVNTWHHVAVTTGGGNINLYIDGADMGSTGWNPTGGIQKFRLGGDLNQANRDLSTEYDELKIYDTTLSGTEVLSLYNSGIIPEPATMSLLALGGIAMLRRRKK